MYSRAIKPAKFHKIVRSARILAAQLPILQHQFFPSYKRVHMGGDAKVYSA